MEKAEIDQIIDDLPDEVLGELAASMPWSNYTGEGTQVVDEDGFPISGVTDYTNFRELQELCWKKFLENPQINTHIQDYMGNLTGFGFNMDSDQPKVAEVMKAHIEDPRNALYRNLPKHVARSGIEGELFLCFTLHNDGFVEIDFMSPRTLAPTGHKQSGIYFHKRKAGFPLFYEFDLKDSELTEVPSGTIVIPSINIAYFPEYATYWQQYGGGSITQEKLSGAKSKSRKFSKIGGYNQFIVEWDKGFFTTRNVSHIRTTLVWLSHYENLKKWEIDHKKSSGSYLWVAYIEDAKSFRTWLKLTDEQKKNTGLFAKKKPGGTIVLPPGIKLECINPNLPKISDADTDIMGMVVSGLNKPEDMVTGATKGSTFSGVKASRGPAADRIHDQIAYFDRFLKLDFWRPLFLLRNAVLPEFKLEYTVEEVVDFKDKKPIKKKVQKLAHDLISIEYPISDISDMDMKASALLGVKHPSLIEVLGIPHEEVARKLGIGNYKKKRLQRATEDENYPDLPTTIELESIQEGGGETKDPKNNPDKGNKTPNTPNKKSKDTEENT